MQSRETFLGRLGSASIREGSQNCAFPFGIVLALAVEAPQFRVSFLIWRLIVVRQMGCLSSRSNYAWLCG